MNKAMYANMTWKELCRVDSEDPLAIELQKRLEDACERHNDLII